MKSETPSSSPRAYNQTSRAEAAEATGQRIVEAFHDRLMAGWFDDITLDQIAADAGVTVQTIIRRFGGKDGLLGPAAKRMGERVTAQRRAPRGDVDKMIDHLLADYERTGEPVLRLLALESRYPVLETVLGYGRAEHRRWAAGLFKGDPSERALDALVIVTDVYTWKLLRRDMGRSRKDAASIIKNLVRAVLAEFS